MHDLTAQLVAAAADDLMTSLAAVDAGLPQVLVMILLSSTSRAHALGSPPALDAPLDVRGASASSKCCLHTLDRAGMYARDPK